MNNKNNLSDIDLGFLDDELDFTIEESSSKEQEEQESKDQIILQQEQDKEDVQLPDETVTTKTKEEIMSELLDHNLSSTKQDDAETPVIDQEIIEENQEEEEEEEEIDPNTDQNIDSDDKVEELTSNKDNPENTSKDIKEDTIEEINSLDSVDHEDDLYDDEPVVLMQFDDSEHINSHLDKHKLADVKTLVPTNYTYGKAATGKYNIKKIVMVLAALIIVLTGTFQVVGAMAVKEYFANNTTSVNNVTRAENDLKVAVVELFETKDIDTFLTKVEAVETVINREYDNELNYYNSILTLPKKDIQKLHSTTMKRISLTQDYILVLKDNPANLELMNDYFVDLEKLQHKNLQAQIGYLQSNSISYYINEESGEIVTDNSTK